MISKLQITHVDEKTIIEQVKDTHNPNGDIDVDANSLLKLLEGIFNFNTDSKSDEDNSEKEDETSNENPESDGDNSENEDETSNENPESDEDNSEKEGSDEDDDEHGKSETVPREAMQDMLQLQECIQKEISFVFLQLSFMVTFTCISYDDTHSAAICLLSLLSKYMWHAKGVMLLACFAIIIQGKSKVASQLCHRKGLSYNMASLKNRLKPMLFPDNEFFFNDSMRSMFNLTKLMVELRLSSSMFLANYWIARCVVAYAHLFILGLEPQNQIMEELSNVSTKIKEILASSLPLLADTFSKFSSHHRQTLAPSVTIAAATVADATIADTTGCAIDQFEQQFSDAIAVDQFGHQFRLHRRAVRPPVQLHHRLPPPSPPSTISPIHPPTDLKP